MIFDNDFGTVFGFQSSGLGSYVFNLFKILPKRNYLLSNQITQILHFKNNIK